MVSNLLESHSPVFFPLVCTSFSSKNVCKKQPATGRFAGFIVRENNRFLLLGVFDNRLQKAPLSFLHTFSLENEAQTSGKKYRAVTFY